MFLAVVYSLVVNKTGQLSLLGKEYRPQPLLLALYFFGYPL